MTLIVLGSTTTSLHCTRRIIVQRLVSTLHAAACGAERRIDSQTIIRKARSQYTACMHEQQSPQGRNTHRGSHRSLTTVDIATGHREGHKNRRACVVGCVASSLLCSQPAAGVCPCLPSNWLSMKRTAQDQQHKAIHGHVCEALISAEVSIACNPPVPAPIPHPWRHTHSIPWPPTVTSIQHTKRPPASIMDIHAASATCANHARTHTAPFAPVPHTP